MATKAQAAGYGFRYEIDGLQELQTALLQLPKQLRRSVLTKALTTAAQPTLALARANVPDSGVAHKNKLRDTLHVSTKLNKNQRRGRGRLADGVEVFIGSTAPHAHLVEFGTAERYRKSGGSTGVMPAKPFLTQAWDATKGEALEILKLELWREMVKAARRLARRAAKGTLSIRTMREMQRAA